MYQSPVHDARVISWETEELLVFIDAKQLELMQSYQQSIDWLSNLVQSTKIYREMRVEFLSRVPATVEGDQGIVEVDGAELRIIMPRIAQLRSLSESVLTVAKSQQPDVRKLIEGYVSIMKPIAGTAPVMDFPATERASPTAAHSTAA